MRAGRDFGIAKGVVMQGAIDVDAALAAKDDSKDREQRIDNDRNVH